MRKFNINDRDTRMARKWMLCAVTVAVAVCGCKKEEGQSAGAQVVEKQVSVKVLPIETRTFEERIQVQGTLEAKNYANVSARVDGTLEELPVDKGDVVVERSTKLFVVDKANRERSVATARQSVATAAQTLKVAQANVERVRVELKKAELDKDRFVRLYKNGSATANELESYTTQYEAARAGLKYAEASEGAASEQLKAAEIALATAEKDLADCTVYAPLGGVVSKRLKEPGEEASKGGIVLRIEDLETLEAVAYIPAAYYGRLEVGKTMVRLAVNGKEVGEYPVTYRSPVIDPALRTFEIKALVRGNAAVGLVPGVMADMTIVLVRREGLAVPTHSVLNRRQGTLIYIPKDGRAVPCGVKVGLENDGFSEIFPAPLTEGGLEPQEGEKAVSEGHYMLSDNDKVKVQE